MDPAVRAGDPPSRTRRTCTRDRSRAAASRSGRSPGTGSWSGAPPRDARRRDGACCARRTRAAAGPPPGRTEAGMGRPARWRAPSWDQLSHAAVYHSPTWAGATAGTAASEISPWEGPGRRPPERAPAWHSTGRSAGAPSPGQWPAHATSGWMRAPRPFGQDRRCSGPGLHRRRPGAPRRHGATDEPRHVPRYPEVHDGVPAQVDPLARERLEQSRSPPRQLPVLDEAQDEPDPRLPPGSDARLHRVGVRRLVRVARPAGAPEPTPPGQHGVHELERLSNRRRHVGAHQPGV